MNSTRRLASGLALACLLVAAQACAQSLFWVDTNFPTPQLGRANTDGSSPVQVPLGAETLPEGLALDPGNGNLYWAEAAFANADVRRAGTDLGGVTPLVTGGSSLRGVGLDLLNSRIYWTSSNLITGSQIQRANLDGSSPQVLLALPAGSNPRGIAVFAAANRIYWADYDLHQIDYADLDGGGVTVLANTGPGPWGVAIDPVAAQLYWTEYVTGTIHRVPLIGGPSTLVLGGLGNPTYLALDAGEGKMYWSEAAAGAQKIQRSNLDGSLLQNLGLPVSTYGGLAVGPSEPTEVLLLTFVADAVSDGVEVRWQFGDPARFSSTGLQRADLAAGPWQPSAATITRDGGVTVALDRAIEAGRTYWYRLAATGADGGVQFFGPVRATAGQPIAEFSLDRVGPNPARGPIRIEYSVQRESQVRLSVVDVQGRVLVRLADGVLRPGRYQATWTGEARGNRAPAGLYFVRYETPEKTLVGRVVLAR